jgi:hypothetical protein
MVLTDTKTEKVPGRITHVYIGYDSTHGVDISSGIKFFDYARVHDARTSFNVSAKTESSIFQPHSNFIWRLEFLSDCRVAFFATDVVGTTKYALVDNGDSNKIGYFKVICPIEDGTGASKTRTYTITNGYALRNGAPIGDDKNAIYWYEGIAEYIGYSDA